MAEILLARIAGASAMMGFDRRLVRQAAILALALAGSRGAASGEITRMKDDSTKITLGKMRQTGATRTLFSAKIIGAPTMSG
ncbi:hypothetical protein E3H11_09030 [Bradyrhizobium brasilense]|uniref:hypothetical protein n=1 Tax=Bradyrhizobium brasilense TaxID=1419277 RepID=UPI0014568837|nr:hypothetical protein [Bradyrhizobium brasilense]NLS69063.1 hypothetical protein [Bradyrhizobium brasilense]